MLIFKSCFKLTFSGAGIRWASAHRYFPGIFFRTSKTREPDTVCCTIALMNKPWLKVPASNGPGLMVPL